MKLASTDHPEAGPAHTNEQAFIDFITLHARLPVSTRTLRGWVRGGLVPSVRMPGGRKRLFHWPSVEAALRRHQTGGVE